MNSEEPADSRWVFTLEEPAMAEDKRLNQEPAEGSREVIERELARSKESDVVKSDAAGQLAQTQHGSGNDGLVSADPRVLSEKDGDATFPVRK